MPAPHNNNDNNNNNDNDNKDNNNNNNNNKNDNNNNNNKSDNARTPWTTKTTWDTSGRRSAALHTFKKTAHYFYGLDSFCFFKHYSITYMQM